jgi:hypothetical protein
MHKHNISNTQRSKTSMRLNQSFSINSISVHGVSSQALCSIPPLALNAECKKNYFSMIQERVPILRFPSQKVELSNLQLISIYQS